MTLQPDLQQILSQALSFLLLLWVLRRFAWRPILGILDQRRARIEEALRTIEQGRQELARLQAEYQTHLTQIDAEARMKIQQAVLEGKRIAAEIQEQARAQAQALLTKSQQAMALELAKAKVTLRDQVAEITLEAVERILRQKLDPTADLHLVTETLEELERSSAKA